jgi:hypothetical protein
MKLKYYELVFVAIGLVGILLIASSALVDLIRAPGGEPFSELYLLGPKHMAENYPFNIAVGQNYSVYVDVTNHLGSSANYLLYVKLKNQTDFFPNATTGIYISVVPLYGSRFAIQDGQSWESTVSFSVTSATFSQNQSVVNKLTISDAVFGVNKPAVWDTNRSEFNYQLVFELWVYNRQSGFLVFDNRYVALQLNLTRTS